MKPVFISLLLVCGSAQAAMGPFDVYEQALRNDPVFLGAIKERDAGLENRTIGRAGLLPRLRMVSKLGNVKMSVEERVAFAMENFGIFDTPPLP